MILTGTVLVDTAHELAHKYHAGQTRADKITPYVMHPIDVAYRFHVAYLDGGYRMLAASDEFRGMALALLHDAAEDTAVTFDDLAAEGMESIIPELKLLTKYDGDSYLAYLLRLKASDNHLALQVKLCDMASNLSDLHNISNIGVRKGLKTKYELARHILLN